MNSDQTQNPTLKQSSDDVAVEPKMSEPEATAAATDLSTDESAELLRLTIPKIAKHGTDFSPLSYAIWYEYVRGGNNALCTEIDESISKTERLNQTATAEMYRHHVADALESALHASRADFLKLLGTVDSTFDSANTSTQRFSDSLETSAERIENNPTEEQIRSTIEELLVESSSAKDVIDILNQEIRASRTETERLALELAQAKQNAEIDPLSGLLNRRGFDKAIDEMITQANESSIAKEKTLSLLIIDIDHFKKVNDTHGHLFGDKVIRTISQIFDMGVMRKDYVARIGGEEFAILLPQTDETGGVAMANRIREAVQSTVVKIDRPKQAGTKPSAEPGTAAQTYRVTISGGVTQYRQGESAMEFVERADNALYHAKQSGRNQVLKSGA